MDHTEIQGKLDAFANDPRDAMNRTLTKYDEADRVIPDPFTAFSAEEIQSRDYVVDKDAVRKTFHMRAGDVVVSLEEVRPGKAPIADIDRPENLVDKLQHVRLAEMETAKLTKAALAESPWSDDYWALYTGALGKRYADPKFPNSKDWAENRKYIDTNPVQAIVASGNRQAIDRLSPSEKYDLLVGDTAGTLTKAMWDEGRSYHEASGQVETWMGLCHGWAPAAYMLARPRKVITVKAADGRTDLRFFPSDVKALATLLWAHGNSPSRFIGSRSNDKEPAMDEVGRVTSPAVFDTNPGTWHMSVVNQIGVAKRSFIIDATFDYEVWNQPVFSYEYEYFNPQRMRMVGSLAEATVPRAQFTSDRFKKYRGTGYASMAGVVMRCRYVVETNPSHAETDDRTKDAINAVDYIYDLELDASGKILGGEWYQNLHPDFLWTPPAGTHVTTPGDRYATGTWSATAPLPEAWRTTAIRTSGRGLPLAKIVEQLIRLASA
jgi:hypothetical protein